MIHRPTLALLFAVFAMAPGLRAQEAPLHWVFFTDKGNWQQHEPTDFLSPAALQRRRQAGIPLERSDYPVASPYLAGLRKAGIRLKGRSRWFNAALARLTPKQTQHATALPYVRRVQPVRQRFVRAANVPAPSEDELTHRTQLNMLGMPEAFHQAGHTGQGVRVAIFDDGFSGVDTLSAFARLRQENRILGSHDFVGETQDSLFRVGGHGTNVLSVMAARQEGELQGGSPDASFFLLRTEELSSESLSEESNWVLAAEWADSAGAQIFQTSLGYTAFDDSTEDHSYLDMDGNTALITRAADMAAGKGILVVNAAGNLGSSAWEIVSAPADGDSVLSVGGVTYQNTVSFFSSRGPTADGRIKPEVVALATGTHVLHGGGMVSPSMGTSFASPLIASFAACLKSARPELSAAELYQSIVWSGGRFQTPDNETGYGLPDAARSLGYSQFFSEQSQPSRLSASGSGGTQAIDIVSRAKTTEGAHTLFLHRKLLSRHFQTEDSLHVHLLYKNKRELATRTLYPRMLHPVFQWMPLRFEDVKSRYLRKNRRRLKKGKNGVLSYDIRAVERPR